MHIPLSDIVDPMIKDYEAEIERLRNSLGEVIAYYGETQSAIVQAAIKLLKNPSVCETGETDA